MLTDTWSNNLPFTEYWPFCKCVSNYTNLPLERRALRPVISTLSRTPKDTVPAMLSPSQLYNCHSRSFGMWSGSSTLPRGLPAAGDSRSPRNCDYSMGDRLSTWPFWLAVRLHTRLPTIAGNIISYQRLHWLHLHHCFIRTHGRCLENTLLLVTYGKNNISISSNILLAKNWNTVICWSQLGGCPAILSQLCLSMSKG